MLEQSRVYQYVEDRLYMGELRDANAVGNSSLDGQPPRTTIYLRICEDLVKEARFTTSGCGFMIASVGALIELATDQTIKTCLSISEQQIVQHLRGIPDPRRYCTTLAIIALRDALTNYTLKLKS